MGSTFAKVKLLRHTPDPEELVAMSARLCYSAASIEEIAEGVSRENQAGFIKKIMSMGHLTVLEHVSFTFGIEGVSRSMLAQITRHRIASFSVQSQRYVGETTSQNRGDTFGFIVPEKVKQLGEEAVEEFCSQMSQIQRWYDGWVESFGGRRSGYEDARFVLPNAAETKIIVTMNARELIHFFKLRCCNRAQWEIRAVANEMLRQVKKVAPTIFKEAGPGCVSGPCPEGQFSCGKAEEVRNYYLNDAEEI
ncbi:thymidylate synthase (FAD) [Desulfohalotomaculum tongense]|uniref:FAD-dependent thymidylate synthase n=1 Tax=Desulforadius tongensis TaxID=1216062 RepID=UPI00195E71EE|nr:FAD-dependent thymidylate synthase [Desulforadius tongensis]MBM7853806.1 thymidylate synthase (FAD) [Desulforadius tongensis]